MSDMYLTKVEKREIFFRSLIFVLAIFAISYFSVVGPFVFTLIPWVFLIGIYGRLRYKDPIITLLITCITITYANFANFGFNMISVINIIVAILGAVAGNVVGKILFKLKRCHNLEIFIKVNVKHAYQIICAICTAIIVFVHVYFNGDIVSYTISRINMHKAIEQEVGTNLDYKIMGVKHIAGLGFKYEYEAKINNICIKAVEDRGMVWYTNSDEISKSMANNLESKLTESLENVHCNFKYIVHVDADHNLNKMLPNSMDINITVTSISDEDYISLANLCKEIYKYILNENIGGIFLNVSDKSAIYSKQDLETLTKDKILESFEVVELDS